MTKIKVGLSLMFYAVTLIATRSYADTSEDISIKIESLNNISGSGALEACGSAVHKNKVKPLMVTVKHDESFYTTLTGPNNKWCVVLKRWNFSGEISVSATTLDKPSEMKLKRFDVSVQ